MTSPIDDPAWHALRAHHAAIGARHMRDLFRDDPGRAGRMAFGLKDLRVDFSKHRVTDETLRLLVALAESRGVPQKIVAMFDGEVLNPTEGRAVLHVALRNRANRPMRVEGRNVVPLVSAVLAKMRAVSERIRHGEHVGHTGEAITDIVNIGIGGSDLGPQMVAEALRPYWQEGLRLHFVSNVDGAHLGETLRDLDAATTLFVVSSKSFGTIETLTNARSARDWLVSELGDEEAVPKHFIAVSSNTARVKEFGIDPACVFDIWDWVGGRFSLWSAIGFPVVCAIGMDRFEELLAGAHEMDEHFRTAPLAENIPVLSALLGVWYRNFFGAGGHAVIPFDQLLHRLPAWLQQCDMESNGKSRRADGAAVIGYQTGPVVFGEPGTNAQHAFFQLLHQGTEIIPCDFLGALESQHERGEHHLQLLANLIAQAEALMVGRTEEEVRAEHADMDPAALERLLPHKVFEGNRPTTTILAPRFDPTNLGRVLAMYEHRTFVQGVIWGVNSFDQWGVELGKALASRIVPELRGQGPERPHDASTTALIAHVLAGRSK